MILVYHILFFQNIPHSRRAAPRGPEVLAPTLERTAASAPESIEPGDADLTVPRASRVMRRGLHANARGARRAVRGQRRAQDGDKKLSRGEHDGVEMLFDGPELRGPELGAMRRRGVRRHAPLGHEPRDEHGQCVRHVQCGVLVRGRRLGLDLIQRKHHRVGYLQGHGHDWHVPRRRLVQPTHRLMGYLQGHVHEPHVLLRRRVQSANQLMGYLQGHKHGVHVLWRRRVQSTHRLMGYLAGHTHV